MTAKEILTAQPEVSDYTNYELLDEEADITLLSVEVSSETLEDEMLRTYLSIMREKGNRDRVKAAGDVAEILGFKGKKAVTVVNAQNAQLNTNNLLPPEMQRHLMGAQDGLKLVTDATDAGIRIKKTGSGN
jgi:hypothetical protein